MKYRLRELDFLRGIAILFVLFRHIALLPFLTKIGWIGVDLFFVLSGFLVSGLLFKEYLKFGNINPTLFLIRRGFKIYPIYYIFYIPYLLLILYSGTFDLVPFLADMTFTQNYIWGWGFSYAASWSLAVEEHFYILFSILLWLSLKYKIVGLQSQSNNKEFKIKSFAKTIIVIIILCIEFRIFANLFFITMDNKFLYTSTHYRIDSLLMGVLIAYFYYFKLDFLTKLFQSKKHLLFSIMILGVCWTPFIEGYPSFFVQTIGFTLLYISFGILLVFFLTTKNINKLLNNFFSKRGADIISKIGVYSYSIYVIHSIVLLASQKAIKVYNLPYNHYIYCIGTLLTSLLLGYIMTTKVEKYFLSLRDKYFPARYDSIIKKQ